MFRRKVFALHGMKFAGMRDGDQIDAGIGFIGQIQLVLITFRPSGVGEHFCVLFFVKRFVLQIGNDQAFKGRALVALGLGSVSIAGKEGLERGHGWSCLSS